MGVFAVLYFVVEVVLWLLSDVSCMLHICLLTPTWVCYTFASDCLRGLRVCLLCLWCFRLIIVRVTCNLLLVVC